MLNTELLNNSVIFPDAVKISTPYKGFTRYLMQNKTNADYIKSDMSKNFIFYEPMNRKVFNIFSSKRLERDNVIKNWNHYVFDNNLYFCQNVEFINKDYQKKIDNIFENPTEELSVYLQSIAETIIDQNKDFEICIGVVHGEQLTDDGVRYPHAHILLKRKENKCQIG